MVIRIKIELEINIYMLLTIIGGKGRSRAGVGGEDDEGGGMDKGEANGTPDYIHMESSYTE
jgi:hypothetical protein